MSTPHCLLVPFLLGLSALAQGPIMPATANAPGSAEQALLGKALFWDEQLSSDDSMACGTCHRPESGGGDPRATSASHPGCDGVYGTADDRRTSPAMVLQDRDGRYLRSPAFGVGAQKTERTAPTAFGIAFQQTANWDQSGADVLVDPITGQVAIAAGAALEAQALVSIMSPVKMAFESRTWADVTKKLQHSQPLRLASGLPADLQQALSTGAGYPDLFAAAFGDHEITPVRIAVALAAYQRALTPDQTPFDAFQLGDASALTFEQQKGMGLFFGRANCAACHPAPHFADDLPHNLGLRPASEDLGRGASSPVQGHQGAFKTPTLRNAGLRPRLFHNGQSPGLSDPDQFQSPHSVASIYQAGGGPERQNLDPTLVPLTDSLVTAAELALVLDFVANGLTDPRAAKNLPPFDRPTLRSETLPASRSYGPSLAGAAEALVVASAPSYLGNDRYKLGFHAGQGNTFAALFYSAQAREPVAVWLGGIPVNIGRNSEMLPLFLPAPTGAAGLATLQAPIPNAPALHDLRVYMQLFAFDTGSPLGVSASQGLEIVLR